MLQISDFMTRSCQGMDRRSFLWAAFGVPAGLGLAGLSEQAGGKRNALRFIPFYLTPSAPAVPDS